jgi:N utilization substance protein B
VFVLYRQDLLRLDAESALGRTGGVVADDYAANLVRGVQSHRGDIDRLLQQHLREWRLDRLGVLERSILRASAYELLEERDVPVAVVVDEAVNLAKRFCSIEAGALVNGILGSVAKEVRGTEPSESVVEEAE